MFWWHIYSFSLDFKQQNEFYKQHSMSGYFSSTCELDISPYEPILSKQYFMWDFFYWNIKKKYSHIQNWHIYFAKTLGQSFPNTRRFHLCVENSDPNYLCQFFIQGYFFFIFLCYNFCMFVQNFGLFYHIFMNILSWESEGTFRKIVFLSLQWKNWCFSTS